MKELGEWSDDVLEKNHGDFFLGVLKSNKSRLLCYLFCASEIVRIKAKKSWFVRTIDEIAADLNMTNRTVARYLREFRQQELIESKKQFLGCKIRLMTRASDNALDGCEFLRKEINQLKPSQVKIFVEKLVPIKKIMHDIESAFY